MLHVCHQVSAVLGWEGQMYLTIESEDSETSGPVHIEGPTLTGRAESAACMLMGQSTLICTKAKSCSSKWSLKLFLLVIMHSFMVVTMHV